MKTRHKLIAGSVAALLLAAGYAAAQIPTLFVTTLTGNEQVNVIVPATGTLTTNPQTQAATINTIKSFVAATSNGVNNQTGTSYTIATTDCGKLVTFNNGSAIAVTLPQATGAFATCQFSTQDIGTGAATITPTTSTIDGASSLVLNQNRGTQIFSDGTNWQIEAGAVGLQATPAIVTEGGTGAATFTNHGVMLGSGTAALGVTAVGTTGQLLQGTSAANPGWSTTLSGSYTFTNALIQAGAGAGTPTHIATGQTTAPALTSCGTGSPAITGTDTAGIVTMGTGATGCIITFNVAYTGTPFCVVSWIATPLASQSYVTSNAAITLTQTSTSGNKAQYICMAPSGG